MKEDRKNSSEAKIRRSTWITVICDAILLVVFVACLLAYIASSNGNFFNQNVDNITNIAESNSQLIQSALDKTSYEVKRAYNYCKGKNITEILDYLSVINTQGEEYQLLTLDENISKDEYYVYSGYSTVKTDGQYTFVEYKNTSLSYSIINYASDTEGEVTFSQSFTNKTDTLRYFAAFCKISLEEDGAYRRYFLVKPQKESLVLNQTQRYSQYANLSIAVCYTDGKYLAHDNSFRANNFFDYLYKYNDLSVDEKTAIKNSVASDTDGKGILRYADYKKRDCVFAYASAQGTDSWIVIVAVPVSEFSAEKLLSAFPVIIIVFLTVLLLFNILRLLMIVRELRSSVARETIANASKSSFLSRMSHEIRTPLNAIIGYNTIAKNEIGVAQNEAEHRQAEMKVMDCLTKSEIASKHLLTVINDVLDMSAIESGRIKIARERFDFRGLITSLTTVFYSQAYSKGVGFEVIFNTLTEEWFIGDQMRVNQILTNLLSNAIKFTPDGGTVVLKITQPDADTDASHIHFEVTDTGIGMAEEYLTHIWTPFEQADSSISRRFGGSGLGLSITKNLIELMDGSITVKSAPGVGTTFGVDLTFGRTEQKLNASSYDFSSVNALVVDDDASTCDYIRLLFNRCGAKCTTVTSGKDALSAVSQALAHGNYYTLCLVDWRMPEMDGIETVKQIRALAGEDVPIVILTAYDFGELTDKSGISGFISKPLFQSSLFDLLAGVCGKGASDSFAAEKPTDFGGARILLAEDNAMNMEIALTIMKSAGLTVDSAWNGREAVDKYLNEPAGTYKVILMDVHMPEMNGHEATKAIRASAHADAATVPIIAMTADAFAENVAEAIASGMNAHISKPIDIPVLFEMLNRYIGK